MVERTRAGDMFSFITGNCDDDDEDVKVLSSDTGLGIMAASLLERTITARHIFIYFFLLTMKLSQ